MEPAPLILTDSIAPGCPDDEASLTPAAAPANLDSSEILGTFANFDVEIVEAEPVKADFVMLPYPVTTTASKEVAVSFIETLITVRPLIGSSMLS